MQVGETIYADIELTYGEGSELFIDEKDYSDPIYKYVAKPVANIPDIQIDPVELDDELGLPIVKQVEKPSIFVKYGVQCDPDKNSFHASLHRQYHEKGYLSPKQVNALRK